MNERSPDLTQWLQRFLGQHGGVAGTVHLLSGELLELAAAVNIPDKVQQVTAKIPRGKGMAGLALERNAPVSTCDLATDSTGDVRPGAKAVDASAAVALPVRDAEGDVRAVVGIAYSEERDWSDEALEQLNAAAADLP